MTRPIDVGARAIALVALGGTAGTALREAATWALPALDALPLATLAVNLTGALLLGVLLEALLRAGSDEGRRRTARLALGTGLLGGFTTYSALTTDAALLIRDGDVGLGIGYALGTVALGALATWAGIALAARRSRSDREASQ